MKTEFGDVAVQEVTKGDNVGWFLDQRLVSILISDWMKQHGGHQVKMVPRNTNTDRSAYMYKAKFYRHHHYHHHHFIYPKYKSNNHVALL